MTIRIALADDHHLVRDGLCVLLQKEADFNVVATADDGHSALALVQAQRPDVLVTDLSMPGMNGLELIRQVRADAPNVQVLCLSMHDEARMVMASIDAGAAGYVLKNSAISDLTEAIRSVHARRVYLSPPLVGIFVEGFRSRRQTQASDAPQLTAREREIVQLFSEGHSTAQIAEVLHVSAKTVATHRENVLHKLSIGSMAELTRYAIREGISSLESPCRSALAAPELPLRAPAIRSTRATPGQLRVA